MECTASNGCDQRSACPHAFRNMEEGSAIQTVMETAALKRCMNVVTALLDGGASGVEMVV
jgi:hypothetical protein